VGPGKHPACVPAVLYGRRQPADHRLGGGGIAAAGRRLRPDRTNPPVQRPRPARHLPDEGPDHRPEGRGDDLPDLLVHRPWRNPARGFIRLHAVPPPAEAVSLKGRTAMSGSFGLRPIGLAAVVLLFGIGFAAVLTHPDRERVSFDAVIAIWSSI